MVTVPGLRPVASVAAAVVSAAVLLSAVPPARAQNVDELVAEALARSPGVAQLRARLAASRAMIAPAGALANPMVETMYQEAGFPGSTVGRVEMSMIGAEVRQPLPYPGKRAARRDAARAEAAAREADVEVLRRQLVRDVRAAYARLYALDREIDSLAPGREMLDLLAATAAARYGAGQAEQEAVVKARLLTLRLGEQDDDLKAERRRVAAVLGRLLDRDAPLDLAPVTALPPPAFPPGPWEERALAASAEVAARRAETEAAAKRADVARRERKPDFSAAAGAAYRGSLDPVVTLRFGIELPFWRREKQEPMVHAAERALEEARAGERVAEAAVRESVRALAATRAQAEAQLVRYREGILPLASAALSAARSDYLAGTGSFTTVVEDFRAWLEARVALARREADLYAAWADLELLVTPAPASAVAGERR